MSFAATSTLALINDLSYFESRYSTLKALQTCTPMLPADFSRGPELPPGVLHVGTMIGPSNPFASRNPASTTSLVASASSPRRSTKALPTSNAQTINSTVSTVQLSTKPTQINSRTGAIPTPLTPMTSQSCGGELNSTGTPTTSLTSIVIGPVPAYSIRSEHVVFRGHTLRTNSTLTLGSESARTGWALSTDALGITVVVSKPITTVENSTQTPASVLPVITTPSQPTTPSRKVPSEPVATTSSAVKAP